MMRYFNEPTDENPKYPCGICSKTVKSSHKATQCDSCNFWNHIKCDQIDNTSYVNLIKSNDIYDLNPLNTPSTNIYYCRIYSKKVGHFHKSVQCDLCDQWSHIKCDGIDNKTYEALKKSSDYESYFCKICEEETFAFQKLSDDEFFTSIVKNIDLKDDLNLFNDLSGHNKDEPSINCDYYDLSIPIPSSSNCNLSIFHLNLASLSLHKDELVTSLSLLEIEFDMIALMETRIRAGIDPTYELSLKGYYNYQTPTESVKGGVIIYIKNNIDVKRQTDLENKMYKSCELESVFLEIVNEGKKNEMFGCIYRHPPCQLTILINHSLMNLLKE